MIYTNGPVGSFNIFQPDFLKKYLGSGKSNILDHNFHHRIHLKAMDFHIDGACSVISGGKGARLAPSIGVTKW